MKFAPFVFRIRGALYYIRRSWFKPLRDDLSCDDFRLDLRSGRVLRADLAALIERIADPLFTGPEPRATFTDLVLGLMTDAPQNNSWQLADHVGHKNASSRTRAMAPGAPFQEKVATSPGLPPQTNPPRPDQYLPHTT